MRHLAKVGFSQSYTYFTWKNTRWELTEYVDELAHTGESDFFRPNFFANTPDILHDYLQHGGPAGVRGAARARRHALSPSYGIYSGFENFENVPVHAGLGGVPRLREVRAEAPPLDGPLLPLVARLNRDTPRKPGAPARFDNIDVPRDRERRADRLREASRAATRPSSVVNIDPHQRTGGPRDRPRPSSGCRRPSPSTTS